MGVAGVAVALAVLAVGAVTPGEARAGSVDRSFALFDNTAYNNAHLAQYGIPPARVIYDRWDVRCANTPDFTCNLPPRAEYQARVHFYTAQLPTTSPVVLDFEGIDYTAGTPADEARNEFHAWETLLQWARAVIPDGQPLGMYSYDYSQNSTEIGYTARLHDEGLTFFAPSLYYHAVDRESGNPAAWTAKLDNAVTNDRAAAPDQPIYPYIWPQWYLKPYTHMDAATWVSELRQLREKTEGAIIWSGTTDITAASCGWVEATRDFMASAPGENASGLLRVDFPADCSLVRGRTTRVPIEVTNTAAAPSSPTTLQISASTAGITASPAARQIPALAPGQSWSTVVSTTVAPSTILGDAIMSDHLGAEVRQRTVIVVDPDLALGARARASSVAAGNGASRAVDGNTDAAVADGSVSMTDNQPRPWIEVDLGARRHIGTVAAWSAFGLPPLSNYYVIVSESPGVNAPTRTIPANVWTHPRPGVWEMRVTLNTFRYPKITPDVVRLTAHGEANDVPVDHEGRYVRLQLAGSTPRQLALSELQVRPGAPVTTLPGTRGRHCVATPVPVANGGFEADGSGSQIPGWTVVYGHPADAQIVATPTYTGSGALRVTDDTNESIGVLSAPIPVTAGAIYYANAWKYVTLGRPSMYVYFYNATGTRISTTFERYAVDTGIWTDSSIPVYTPPDTASVRVLLYSATSAVTTTVWDDITISRFHCQRS